MGRSSNRTLLVFVKAPSPGQVKTRLVPVLSPSQACRLYRCLAQDTLAAARRLRGVQVVLAYAANKQFPDCAWLDAKLPVVLQDGRGLGERLTRAFRWACRRASRVVAIGSDAPQLSAAWLQRAFDAFEQAEVVLGPTVDGGYHLIGLQAPIPALFTDMPWSTNRLLAQTLERIAKLHLTARCLSAIRDLDTPEDLRYFAGGRRVGARTGRFLKELRALRAQRLEDRGAGAIA